MGAIKSVARGAHSVARVTLGGQRSGRPTSKLTDGLNRTRRPSRCLFLHDLHVFAQGALQAGAGGGVIVQGLGLGGARLGQRSLRVEHVQLGGAAGGVPGFRQAERFLRFFPHQLLRFQHFPGLDEIGQGRARIQFDLPLALRHIELGPFVMRLGFLDLFRA